MYIFFFNDTATTEIYTLSLTRRSSDLPVEAAVSDIEPGVYQHIRLTLQEVADAILARGDRAVLGVDVVLVGRVALEGHSARQANVESAFRSVGPRGDEIDDLAGWAAGRWTVDQVDVTAVRQGGVKAGERRGDTGPGELEPCLGLLDDFGLEGLNV